MKTWSPLSERLYEAFRNYAHDVLPLIQSASGGPFGSLVSRMVVSTGPSVIQVMAVQIPSWARIISESEGRLRSLASYAELLQIIRSDPRAVNYANKVYHRNDGNPLSEQHLSTFFNRQVIMQFLSNYLDGQNNAQLIETRFLRIYSSHEEWLLADSQTIRTVGTLFSFLGPDHFIEVDDEIKIRQAADADFTELINRTGLRHEELGVGNRRWLIEIESHLPNSIGANSPSAATQVEDVLKAMRLTKKGGVQCTYLFSARKDDNSAASFINLPPAHIGFASDFTSEADVNEFLRLFRALKALKPTSSLSFAIRRFNYAYERSRNEDRFIDLMIVLESLFVEDGGAGEIAYKFRMRIAAFLCELGKLDERRTYRDIAKTAYEMRSAIVHGGTKKQGELLNKLNKLGIGGIDGLTERIEDYARRTIRILLDNPDLALPDRLDDRLLSGWVARSNL